MKPQPFDPEDYPIVLYDSQCLICDGFVRFIIRTDTERKLKFSGLHSSMARHEIQLRAIPVPEHGTVVILHRDSYLIESDAVLEILKIAGFPSYLTSLLQRFPKKWRDNIYGWTARNRYRFYKKRTYCPLPKPEEASRFV